MQNRKIILTMVLAGVVFLPACSPFQFEHHASFGQWYRGKSGFDRAIVSSSCETLEDRHWLYLHFRLPELIFNPQGGLRYPERCYQAEGGGWYYAGEGVVPPSGKAYFTGKDDGLVEVLFSYRSLNVDRVDGMRVEDTLIIRDTVNRLFIYPFSLIPRVPFYAIHDVVKTAMIPYALVHYTMIGETTLKDNMRLRMEQHKIISRLFFYPNDTRARNLGKFDHLLRDYIATRSIGFLRYAPENARIHIVAMHISDVELARDMANNIASEMMRRGIPADRISGPRVRLLNGREKPMDGRRSGTEIRVLLVAAPAESSEMYRPTKENFHFRKKQASWSNLEP